jgi:hypothetical protein
MRGTRLAWLLAVTCSVVANTAQAQDDYDGPWEKFSLSVGGFLTETDTTIQINSESLGVGAVVELEDVLGVERSFSTYRIDATYRFGQTRRHEIEFHHFSSKRSGDKTLDEELQIGDIIFPADTGVITDFEMTFTNVDYVYNFLLDDRVRFGVSAGLHTTGFRLKVAETGGVNVEDQEFTAPLPMVGLRLGVLLSERWRFRTDVNLFYIEFDNYTGRLGDIVVAVEYNPWKNFGFGAGLNAINYRVEAKPDADLTDLNGQVKFQLNGVMFYGKYFF